MPKSADVSQTRCAVCTVSDGKTCIRCSVCEGNFHPKCVNLDARGLHFKKESWICNDCNRVLNCENFFSKISSVISKGVHAEVALLHEEIKNLRKEVEVLKGTNDELIKLFAHHKSDQINDINIISVTETKLESDLPVIEHEMSISKKDDIEDASTIIPEPDGFKVIASKKKKRGVKPLIIGTGNGIGTEANHKTFKNDKSDQKPRGLTGSERRRWIYIGRVKAKTSEEDVINYIKDTWSLTDVSCAQLKSNEEFCSFKVGVKESVVKAMMDANKWPKYVAVREFIQFPRRTGDKKNYSNENFQQQANLTQVVK